jgi:hypothetical protein
VRDFIPNKVILLHSIREAPTIIRLAELTNYHSILNVRATASAFLNHYCELPVNDVDTMLEQSGKR